MIEYHGHIFLFLLQRSYMIYNIKIMYYLPLPSYTCRPNHIAPPHHTPCPNYIARPCYHCRPIIVCSLSLSIVFFRFSLSRLIYTSNIIPRAIVSNMACFVYTWNCIKASFTAILLTNVRSYSEYSSKM